MTDAVSSHGYGPEVVSFLEGLGRDAWVLDAGAGLRRRPTRNVINMEIYDYPSTDILAIGQNLPFKDNTFDGVLSLAVLEHVDDPFLCASELVRVLKPGGKIMVIIPFLQSEHGYPSHFFNATRFGVRKLFEKGASLERQFLDFSNHPVFTLHQILGQYAAGLEGETREAFLNAPIRTFVDTNATKLSLDGNPFVKGYRRKCAGFWPGVQPRSSSRTDGLGLSRCRSRPGSWPWGF
jgi:SAM-dependent methyltransferase